MTDSKQRSSFETESRELSSLHRCPLAGIGEKGGGRVSPGTRHAMSGIILHGSTATPNLQHRVQLHRINPVLYHWVPKPGALAEVGLGALQVM